MSENPLHFDPVEAQTVARASNPGVTRRRILFSVLAPLALIALLLGVFWRDAQPRSLLWLFVGYVAINLFEKVGYGLTVLSYKSIIRKLLARVSELERRPAAAD